MASMESGERLVQSKYEGSPRRLIWTTCLACLGAMSFGIVIGYSSPAIPSMLQKGVLDDKNVGWFGSLITVGAIFGGPAGGMLIEKYGRKRSLLITSVPFLLGWMAIISSSGVTYLLVGRFLTGIGSGLVTVCVPVYVAEVSTKSMRGVLGSCTQLFITIGIFLAYVFGLYFDWRQLSMLAVVPALLQFVASFMIPETPRWLLQQNRKNEALQALKALRDPHMDVEDECRDIEDGIDSQEKFVFSELFSKSELSRPLFIAVFLFIFQQLSGINAVMFYTVSIFHNVVPDYAYIGTVAIGATQVVATFFACLLMDRAGRRKLLLVAGSIMSVTLLGFAFYQSATYGMKLTSPLVKSIPIFCLVVYIIGFSLGWGPIPVLVMSEIFPSRSRGAASSVAILGNWVMAFIITKEFMTMRSVLGEAHVFYAFGVFCALSVVFVWKYVPETKGKSLEDIELYFLGRTLLDK